MIVRILGEGQYQVDDEAAAKLTELDSALDAAVDSGDEAAFRTALDAAAKVVKEAGTPVPADSFETAEYILPFSDATVAEVRQLLADGKIPGASLGLPAEKSGNV
jgi:propanediol dehydratase small subunit